MKTFRLKDSQIFSLRIRLHSCTFWEGESASQEVEGFSWNSCELNMENIYANYGEGFTWNKYECSIWTSCECSVRNSHESFIRNSHGSFMWNSHESFMWNFQGNFKWNSRGSFIWNPHEIFIWNEMWWRATHQAGASSESDTQTCLPSEGRWSTATHGHTRWPASICHDLAIVPHFLAYLRSSNYLQVCSFRQSK